MCLTLLALCVCMTLWDMLRIKAKLLCMLSHITSPADTVVLCRGFSEHQATSLPLCLSRPLVPLERLAKHRFNHVLPSSAEKLAGALCCICVAGKKKTTREFTGSEQKHTSGAGLGAGRSEVFPASFCATFPCPLCCQPLQLISEFLNKQHSFFRPSLCNPTALFQNTFFCPSPSWPG